MSRATKFSPAETHEILAQLENGMSCRDVARERGCSPQTIANIAKRYHGQPAPSPRKHPEQQIAKAEPVDVVGAAVEALELGVPFAEVAGLVRAAVGADLATTAMDEVRRDIRRKTRGPEVLEELVMQARRIARESHAVGDRRVALEAVKAAAHLLGQLDAMPAPAQQTEQGLTVADLAARADAEAEMWRDLSRRTSMEAH